MANNSGSNQIIAATIVGVALVVTGFVVKAAVDGATSQLNGIKIALADQQKALEQVAQARPAAAAPARRGPDPNKRYTIATNGSPARGVKTAKVTVVEYSDFQ